MRNFLALWLVTAALAARAHASEADVVATVQKLFDAMAARDAAAIGALMTPQAQIVSIRANQSLSTSTGADFATRIGAAKEPLLERMWQPKVMIEGGMATLWAPYDFHRAGKLTHCGVDSVTLFQTPDGWKISGVYFNIVEASKCAPSPLGPPPAK